MKIVILAGKTQSSNMLYNEVSKHFQIEKIVFENPIGKFKFLKKRIHKLGFMKVLSQTLFRIFIQPILSFTASKRRAEICSTYNLSPLPPPQSVSEFVHSVNSVECIDLLKDIQPDIVIINGTRILSKRLLESTPAKFVNIHAGITPMYRGVHGAYWAKTQDDLDNCGVTLHLVDTGIDTGDVLSQAKIPLDPRDNFATYPILQLGEGLKLLVTHLKNQAFKPIDQQHSASKLWHHPTVGTYLYHRIFHNVK